MRYDQDLITWTSDNIYFNNTNESFYCLYNYPTEYIEKLYIIGFKGYVDGSAPEG
jgi:hypothetical protein